MVQLVLISRYPKNDCIDTLLDIEQWTWCRWWVFWNRGRRWRVIHLYIYLVFVEIGLVIWGIFGFGFRRWWGLRVCIPKWFLWFLCRWGRLLVDFCLLFLVCIIQVFFCGGIRRVCFLRVWVFWGRRQVFLGLI